MGTTENMQLGCTEWQQSLAAAHYLTAMEELTCKSLCQHVSSRNHSFSSSDLLSREHHTIRPRQELQRVSSILHQRIFFSSPPLRVSLKCRNHCLKIWQFADLQFCWFINFLGFFCFLFLNAMPFCHNWQNWWENGNHSLQAKKQIRGKVFKVVLQHFKLATGNQAALRPS